MPDIKTLLAQAAQLQTDSDGDIARRLLHSREIEISAASMQKRLRRLNPNMAAAADASPNSQEGEGARRKYLTATANSHRCEQTYQLARKQRAQLHILLDANGRLSK